MTKKHPLQFKNPRRIYNHPKSRELFQKQQRPEFDREDIDGYNEVFALPGVRKSAMIDYIERNRHTATPQQCHQLVTETPQMAADLGLIEPEQKDYI